MKKRIKAFFLQLWETVKASPGESVLILFFFVFCALVIERVEFVQEEYLLLYSLFFTLTFLLNRWCPTGALRWIYYLSPLVALPFLWVDVDTWVGTTPYIVAVAICPFLVFCSRWRRKNAPFTVDVLHYLKNIFFAFVLAGTGFLLMMAIYFSLDYIFPSLPLGDKDKVVTYFALTFFGAMLPLTFLSFVRLQKNDYRPVAIFDMLANYLLAPALLVYTAILYAYFLKILFIWSLPQGNIAYMVFAFTLLAVLVKAYQPLVARRLYDWFFDHFSLISLPALAMFWVGVCYRIGQYGFTEERIYLILSGIIMTFAVLMFLVPRIGRYLYATLLGIALFSFFTFIPGVSAEEIALRSQAKRFEAVATRLGMFGTDGKLISWELPPADSTNYRDYETAYSTFEYLYRNTPDSLLKERYGYESIYELNDKVFPENILHGSRYFEESIGRYGSIYRESFSIDLQGFSKLHAVSYGAGPRYSYQTPSETLILCAPDGKVLLEKAYFEVLAKQLSKMNLADTATISELEERGAEFLVYDHAPWRLLFSSVSFRRDSVLTINDISVDWLLEK